MRPTERQMNTAVYFLRCLQIGLHMSDLEQLTVGFVFDVLTEAGNDSAKYRELATQRDFDRF